MTSRLALRTALAAAAALLSAGCGLIQFDVDSKGTTTVQGNPLGAALPGQLGSFGFTNFDLSQQAGFNNKDTRKDHISSARLTKLTMKVTSPAGQDLSFFSSMKFTIAAASPPLPSKEIAHLESFPAGASTVSLILDDVDIADYAKADSFTITTQAAGRSPNQDTTIEASLTVNIHANPL